MMRGNRGAHRGERSRYYYRSRFYKNLNPISEYETLRHVENVEDLNIEELKKQEKLLHEQLEAINNRIKELQGKVRLDKDQRTISKEARKVSVNAAICRGCGICAEACPVNAIIVDDVARVDQVKCTGCAKCIDACPIGAIRLEHVKQ